MRGQSDSIDTEKRMYLDRLQTLVNKCLHRDTVNRRYFTTEFQKAAIACMQHGVSYAEIMRIGGVSPASLANWRRKSSSGLSGSMPLNSPVLRESCEEKEMPSPSFHSLPVLTSGETRPAERPSRQVYTICVGNKVKIKTSSSGLSRELVSFLQQLVLS